MVLKIIIIIKNIIVLMKFVSFDSAPGGGVMDLLGEDFSGLQVKSSQLKDLLLKEQAYVKFCHLLFVNCFFC